jgi:ribonucleoside-diphosphate reductase beta chain
VRREPANRRAWVESIVTYHLIIEGYLALAGQRNLLRYFRNAGLMPGFTTGFTAVARDESRHIGFGVLALRRRVVEDAEMGRVVARKVLELLEPAAQTAVNPESKLNIPDPATVPPELRQSPVELREFSIGSLSKRLRSVGLSDATVSSLADEMRGVYERLWDRYEEIHGVEHPVRWYQREEAATAR